MGKKIEYEIEMSTVNGGSLTPVQEMARTYATGVRDLVLPYGDMFEIKKADSNPLSLEVGSGIAVIESNLCEISGTIFDLEPMQSYAVYLEATYVSALDTGKTLLICEEVNNIDECKNKAGGDSFLLTDNSTNKRILLLAYVDCDEVEVTYIEDLRNTKSEIEKLKYDTGWVDATQFLTTRFKASDNLDPLKIRRIGNIVYLAGGILPTAAITTTTTAYDVLNLPDEFKPRMNHGYIAWSTGIAYSTITVDKDSGKLTIQRSTINHATSTWTYLNTSWIGW